MPTDVGRFGICNRRLILIDDQYIVGYVVVGSMTFAMNLLTPSASDVSVSGGDDLIELQTLLNQFSHSYWYRILCCVSCSYIQMLMI